MKDSLERGILRFHKGMALTVIGLAVFAAHCSAVQNAPLSSCQEIRGIPGPADMALDERSSFGGDRLIVASQERRSHDPEGEYLSGGAIYFVPLSGRNRFQAIRFSFNGRDEYPFHPEGLDLISSGGSKYLYVVNYARMQQPAVELFRVDRDTLVFMGRYRNSAIQAPSDIVGLGVDQFYLLNGRSDNALVRMGRGLLFQGSGNLYYVDQYEATMVLRGLSSPSSLALSSDGTTLWIADGSSLKGYQRGAGSQLDFIGSISLDGRPGRLSYRDGQIVTAILPGSWAMRSHASDSASKVSSTLIQADAGTGSVQLIYQDDGSEMSAANGAIRNGGKIYLGQVYDSFLLACDYP
ncbi:MAG: hypothetical protein KDK33_18890 [Leptospiraceae bacterium]|nr:hypothetical protein [Leptospiraceae bacterium]